ncbi:translation initiation factor infB [Acrasis kona]|uniref:Translation initiation factor IF-2, chloroplastic n=1 Tax=Acrasis kona TaxID=1008807 RepID=A0AAW2ZP55_9EUKA
MNRIAVATHRLCCGRQLLSTLSSARYYSLSKKEVWKMSKKEQRRKLIRDKTESKSAVVYPKVFDIKLKTPMSTRILAEMLCVPALDMLPLIPSGCGIDDVLSMRTIKSICRHVGVEVVQVPPTKISKKEVYVSTPFSERQLTRAQKEGEKTATPRDPVVTIMGHVDHGKTTLLDALRNTNIVDSEAGGITQNVTAFQVKLGNIVKNINPDMDQDDARSVTFIDTPGHEAFVGMRSAGARVTDVVVLVVAADDGIMPQTEEVISHLKKFGAHVIVAVNKIDKDNADVDLVLDQLVEYGLVPEQRGGNTQVVPVSALKKKNLDRLIEEISLYAEVNDLKVRRDTQMEATVIESKVDRGYGMVVTALIRRGTLLQGQIVVAGLSIGRVRFIKNHLNETIEEGLPSQPVHIVGFESMPSAGDVMLQVQNEESAKRIVEYRIAQKNLDRDEERAIANEQKLGEFYLVEQEVRDEEANNPGLRTDDKRKMSIARLKAQVVQSKAEDLQIKKRIQEYQIKNEKLAVDIVFRADVAGTVDAFHEIVSGFPTDEIVVRIAKVAVGQVTEADVEMAKACNATIICMNVKPNEKVVLAAKNAKVNIVTFKVIYHLIDHLKKMMSEVLPPLSIPEVIAEAEVKQFFSVDNGKNAVAGSNVRNGNFNVSADYYRVVRNGVIVRDKSKINSLYHYKEKVNEIKKGNDCGIVLDGYDQPEPGDKVQAIKVKKEIRDFAKIVDEYRKNQKTNIK